MLILAVIHIPFQDFTKLSKSLVMGARWNKNFLLSLQQCKKQSRS